MRGINATGQSSGGRDRSCSKRLHLRSQWYFPSENVACFLPKRQGSRSAIVWATALLLSTISLFVGYIALLLEIPEYPRGSSTVVWGTYVMNAISHPMLCAGIMVVSFPRLRHILPPPFLAAVVNVCMVFGVITADSSKRWYFLGFALLFYIAMLLSMFLPYFGIGSGDRAPAVSSKKSTSIKRLAFQIIYTVAQALSIFFWTLEPAMGDIISRGFANLLYAVLNLGVIIFAFLVFMLFKPDSDPEVGKFVAGQSANTAALTADDEENEDDDDDAAGGDVEAPRPPADQAPKAGFMFAARNQGYKLFA